jgi:NodT family efflux transporter outer membrane factor (OMF) lipoprotein
MTSLRAPSALGAALLASVLLAGPAVAAPRARPSLPSAEARFSTGTTTVADTPDAWWEAFGDPALNALVEEAIESNFDIASAQARVRQARGVSLQQFSPLVPSASFDVGLSASPTAAQGFQIPPFLLAVLDQLNNIPGQPPQEEEDDGEDPKVIWNGSALFNFGLAIDIGATAMSFRAAQMDAAAAEGDRDGVARQLVAQVVTTWMDVRNARARIAIIEQQIATNTNLLELTRNRYEGGDASGLDVLQQQQQLASTRALLPQAQQILRLREQQLALLVARDPSGIAAGLADAPASLPALPPHPGLGTPRDLLSLRPDLAALNARYLGSKARKDAAILGFLPTFRLNGNAGWNYRWFDEWDSTEVWGFGVSMSVPIFNGGRRWGALQSAHAAQDAAALALSTGVLKARSEVEQALAREQTDEARLEALGTQLQAATVAYQESVARYAGGLANYLTVLSNLASLQASQLNHLQAQRDVLGDRIDLHTALGAPWADRLSTEGAPR